MSRDVQFGLLEMNKMLGFKEVNTNDAFSSVEDFSDSAYSALHATLQLMECADESNFSETVDVKNLAKGLHFLVNITEACSKFNEKE